MANDNIDTNRYPPLSPDELRDCHSYENLDRVVVTQNGVYGRSSGGGWVRLQPIAEVMARRT
jgi:hypothetical protein